MACKRYQLVPSVLSGLSWPSVWWMTAISGNSTTSGCEHSKQKWFGQTDLPPPNEGPILQGAASAYVNSSQFLELPIH